MNCRKLLPIAVAATFVATALPAVAAMPVASAASLQAESELVLAQAKKKKKSTQQQEIDKSVESGTVPKRYKSSVPKQYHHLIPFSK